MFKSSRSDWSSDRLPRPGAGRILHVESIQRLLEPSAIHPPVRLTWAECATLDKLSAGESMAKLAVRRARRRHAVAGTACALTFSMFGVGINAVASVPSDPSADSPGSATVV